MADTSAVPSNDLTTVNTSPAPGAPTSRFILFSNDWLSLQNYVQQALKLPLTTNDFAATYGDFPSTDTATIKNAVAALAKVRDLSSTFGDPSTLKSKIIGDRNYLQTNTPPAEIYAHIVWLGNRIYNAASTFTATFQALSAVLGPTGGTAEQRAANLKLILDGPGGLVSTANQMRDETNALLNKLLDFDGKITAANVDVQTYVGQQSALLESANKMIGQINQNIIDLQDQADDAYAKWRDYTIAAVTTSVGLMVLSCGLLWPVAVGLGVGLGVAAAKQKAIYNALCDDIATQKVDLQKKTLLVTDLTGFNKQIAFVAPALTSFKQNLQLISGVWNDVGMNLSYIANNYTVSQLSDLSWVMQAMKIVDATSKWQAIGSSVQQFTQNSLVTYDFTTKFGQKIA